MKKSICVLGLGYMGLPTSLLLSKNFSVVGVDINESHVERVRSGHMPFDEPGLKELYEENKHNFEVSTEVPSSDVYIMSVPTPLDKGMNIAGLKHVKQAAEMIIPHIKDNSLVIIESTISPGTCEELVFPILKRSGKENLKMAHCPERAIPGKTLDEMINNDRIIGGIDSVSTKETIEIYKTFVKGTIYPTNIKTAEYIKLMENTYRDVNIALANEFALIAEEGNINVWEAINLANKHPRVNIHSPGPGVGGHCIAIDPWFLTEGSSNTKLISTSRQINDTMPNHVLLLIKKILKKNTKAGPHVITILGVAYKGNVDDARETPAIKLIRLAENNGYIVKLHDPFVKNFPYSLTSLEDACRDSDCLIIITDHDYYKKLKPQKISSLMRTKNILDTRNIIDLKEWEKHDFYTYLLGDSNPKKNY